MKKENVPVCSMEKKKAGQLYVEPTLNEPPIISDLALVTCMSNPGKSIHKRNIGLGASSFPGSQNSIWYN
uniref:Uncharacterized protein n=2 Tax=Rhabditophanes sp. KR3021 TaxID=114890 RepID=A0AC35UA25_9BILA